MSVASEWVRNEASEAKRRGILVPVFLEEVDAPLAFRLLNGADLHDWQAGKPNSEFDQLVERVAELLGKPQSSSAPVSSMHPRSGRQQVRQLSRARLSAVFIAVVVIAIAAFFIYKNHIDDRQPKPPKPVIPPITGTEVQGTSPEINLSDLEKTLKGLAVVGGSVPATAVTTAFHVPDLGLRVAFIGPQQSQSMLGSMPPGRWSWRSTAAVPPRKLESMSLTPLKELVRRKSKPWMTCVKPFANSVQGKLRS